MASLHSRPSFEAISESIFGAGMAFRCVVVTPEQQALDESVTQVILPAHDGQIGILTGRAPLLVKLSVGPLRVDLAGGQQKTFFIDGGIGQMKDNLLTILTDE